MDRLTISLRTLCLFAALAVATLATGAAAQEGSPGWNAWIGCWAPDLGTDAFAPPAGEPSALCLIPAAGSGGVELLSIEEGSVVDRQLVGVSGSEASVERDGCTGTETLAWSADGQRIFQNGNFDCPGDLRRKSSGIFAISRAGEWIAVEAISVAGEPEVRAVTYRPAPMVAEQIDEVRQAVDGRAMAIDAARSAAGSRIEIEDVLEAEQIVDVAAVEGWLIEQEQGFDIDAARLMALADAGVSDRLIDLMVALSYPRVFAIDRTSREGEIAERDGRPRRPTRGGMPVYYPRFGGYYPGYMGGGWYGRPVIIVRDPDIRPGNSGGRAVKGRGYTRSNGGGSGSPSIPQASGSPSGGGQVEGGGGSGGGSDTNRTARPRS